MTPAPDLPERFADISALEDFMTQPSQSLIDDLAALDGDIVVLGVAGKMGPTLARLAKRAAPHKRVLGVARFSDPTVRTGLERHGVECLACDLLERRAVQALPGPEEGFRNVVFMAGHKFGADGDPSFTWAMNVAVPLMIAERYQGARIVVFSTACVYPFADVNGPGSPESQATTPPPGDYATSCVGRERMFDHGSRRWHTPTALMRLSYAIDMRYGVLHDVARAVFEGSPIDLTMGYADVIWQGDANEQALRLLGHCATPALPINITGATHTSIRWLAREFGRRLDCQPILQGSEAATAWLVDTTLAQRLFGQPRIGINTLIDWQADWIRRGQPGLGKPTHFSTRDGKY